MSEVIFIVTATATGYEVRMPIGIFISGLSIVVGAALILIGLLSTKEKL